jgi:hypothetical protein
MRILFLILFSILILACDSISNPAPYGIDQKEWNVFCKCEPEAAMQIKNGKLTGSGKALAISNFCYNMGDIKAYMCEGLGTEKERIEYLRGKYPNYINAMFH